MKIVIAGVGYVGNAIDTVLEQKHDTYIVDPKLNTNKISDIDYDALIICVSTPLGNNGACNMQNVFDCISDSNSKPILIKSTISLEGWNSIKEKYPNKDITFSPEFLRAETSLKDFATQETMYLSEGNHLFWVDIFKPLLPDVGYKLGTAEELILAKYFRNSFLATKVIFFNQIFDLCKKIRTVDYEAIRQIVTDDSRIGEGHSKITDERGFGGHCFPKDTKAIVETANKNKSNLSLIKTAIEYNKEVQSNNKVNLDLRTLQKESARALVVMQNADNLSLSEINQKVNHDSTLFYKKVLEKYIELFGDLPSKTKEGKEVTLIME